MAADASTSRDLSGGPDDDGTQMTYNETVEALCGFIKSAIHTILCHRQVYPSNVFTRRQRYRVPVWASRHPGLNTYIDDVLGAVKVQVQKNLVRSVHMVISSASSGSVLERYRFDVDFILPGVPLRDRDFSIAGNMTMQTIELQLRAFMMKLISLDGALYDMDDPDDLTWALVLDMKEGSQPESGEAKGVEPSQGPWVPFNEGRRAAEERSDVTGSSGERPAYLRAHPLRSNGKGTRDDDGSGEEDDAQIVPIRSLDTGVINLMFYVEEHPSAKRRTKRVVGKGKATASATPKGLRRKATVEEEQRRKRDEALRAGERDLDQPLPQPSSSGVPGKTRKGKQEKKSTTVADGEDDSDASESLPGGGSDSGDSMRSVNDFAGFGGTGGVGMTRVGI